MSWVPIVKKFDFFRKLPTELAEASTSGAIISVIAAIIMTILFITELKTFLTIEERSNIFIDNKPTADKM